MTKQYDTALSKVQYNKKEFAKYSTNLKAAMRLHTDKLDSVMTDGKMNKLIETNLEDKYKLTLNKNGDRVYDNDAVAARIATHLAEFKAEVSTIILLTIPDGSYKDAH